MDKRKYNPLKKDDFINESLTIKARSDPKFIKYTEWLKKNGAIFDLVALQTSFFL